MGQTLDPPVTAHTCHINTIDNWRGVCYSYGAAISKWVVSEVTRVSVDSSLRLGTHSVLRHAMCLTALYLCHPYVNRVLIVAVEVHREYAQSSDPLRTNTYALVLLVSHIRYNSHI